MWLTMNILMYIALFYSFILLLWGSLFIIKPGALLNFHDTLSNTPFKLPIIKISVSHLLLLPFLARHSRVLNAWVISSLEKRPSADNNNYIPLPVIIDGKRTDAPRFDDFSNVFNKNKLPAVITGQGGSGKSTLANKIYEWALAESDKSGNPVYPVLIKNEKNIETDAVIKLIQGKTSKKLSPNSIALLLKKRRILLILDTFSEYDNGKLINYLNNSKNTGLINAAVLVVPKKLQSNNTIIKVLPLEGQSLATFAQKYVEKQSDKKPVTPVALLDYCSDLQKMTGEQPVSILVAKTYFDWLISDEPMQDKENPGPTIIELLTSKLKIDEQALKDITGLDPKIVKKAEIDLKMPGLIEMLDSKDNKMKLVAMDELETFGPDMAEAVPHLMPLLEDFDDRVKIKAAKTLGEAQINAVEAIPLLVSKLGSKDQTILLAAEESLVKIGIPSVNDLIKSLKSKNTRTIKQTIEVLGKIGPNASPSASQIGKLLSHENKRVRRSAAKALLLIGEKSVDALPSLINALKGKDVTTKRTAAKAIENYSDKGADAVEDLITLLKSDNFKDRDAASCALIAIGGPSIEKLIDLFKEDNKQILQDISKTLAGIGKPSVPALINKIGNKNWRTSNQAIITLGEIGPDASDAISSLMELLDSSDTSSEIKRSVIITLGMIGQAAEIAVPKIILEFDNEDPWTAKKACDRLIRMIVMGDKKGALENKLVWKCVSCYTCGTRCPNDIQTGKITEALKRIAKKENAEVCDPKVQNFHEAFTGSAVRWGRLNEVEFMGFYQLKNSISDMKRKDVGAIFDELMTQTKMLIPMLSKKRMHFGFQSSKGRDEIKRLMKKGFKK
jgi:heterodisulfide reductase subunit C2